MNGPVNSGLFCIFGGMEQPKFYINGKEIRDPEVAGIYLIEFPKNKVKIPRKKKKKMSKIIANSEGRKRIVAYLGIDRVKKNGVKIQLP